MARRCIGLIVAVVALAWSAPLVRGQVPSATRVVEKDELRRVGVELEHEFERGEVHVYRLRLEAGQYAHVRIDQRRLQLKQRLVGPGATVIEHLGEPARQVHGGPDRVVVVADADAEYQVEVREINGGAGRYAVTLAELGETNTAERRRFEAQNAVAAALTAGGLMGGPPAMLAQIEQSLETWRDLRDPAGEVATLLTLGLSHWLGDRRLARPYFLEALALTRRVGDAWGELEALNDLGEVATSLGELRQAIDYLTQALHLWRRLDPDNRPSLLLHNLAVAERDAGEFQVALRHAHEALAIWRDRDSTDGQAFARHNIGIIHHRLGDPQTALEFLGEALALWRSLQPHFGVGQALTSLGTVRASMGEHRSALDDFRQAIVIWNTAFTSPDTAGAGRATYRLAASEAALADWASAADNYRRALALFRAAGTRAHEADALRGLGEVAHATGGMEQAEAHFATALGLHRAAEDRAGEAATLFAMARVARDCDRLADARSHIEAALVLIEALRTTVASQDLRASFVASKRDYYDFYVDLLMRQHLRNPAAGHAEAALVASERGRARSLMETLIEGGSDIRQGVPPELLDRERSLRQSLTSKAVFLTRLLSAPSPDQRAAPLARTELQTIVREIEDVQGTIRAASPRYAALTQPQALDLAAIRDRILDDETALVEYALGAEQSYAWVVTRRSFEVRVLPKRATIEAAARETHKLFAASDRREAWAQAQRSASHLSGLVLGPIAGDIAYRRLLVVPDGALHYIPFAALPHPKGNEPLVASHEIVSLPSAAALAVIRSERPLRPRADKAVAVLADPVLDVTDPRVRRTALGQARTAPSADLLRSASETGFAGFERLQFSREEADSIARIAGRAGVLYSVDFDASRATATSGQLAGYRIVHFATHGLINSRHPQLSGLVFSLVDSEGGPQDGFLRLHDIYNLKLGAELVVLSACRTALGEDVRGEGLVGLTRGFMYAGAPRVVASLWDVRDRATAELMKRFYTRMLSDKMSPAAALRSAQVSMWREPRWRAPSHWAGFVLQGDWQ